MNGLRLRFLPPVCRVSTRRTDEEAAIRRNNQSVKSSTRYALIIGPEEVVVYRAIRSPNHESQVCALRGTHDGGPPAVSAERGIDGLRPSHNLPCRFASLVGSQGRNAQKVFVTVLGKPKRRDIAPLRIHLGS